MKKVVEIAHDILHHSIYPSSVCADFTMGQGWDTLFLAQRVLHGKVYAFDIQPQAYQMTQKRLQEAGVLDRVELILDSHEHCDRYLHEKLDVGIFNFGYLPHGDTSIVTEKQSSLCAVKKALRLLKKHGILVLVIYPGHARGEEESKMFQEWCAQLKSNTFSVCRITMHNKEKCPYILVIEKEKEEQI